jgi:FO synthase
MIDVEQLFNFEPPSRRIERLLPLIDPKVARVLERALAGKEIGETDGVVLSEVTGSNLSALVSTADLLRERSVGDTVSYVVCRNINFTNICYVGCKFCAFSTGPGKPDAWDHPLEEVGRREEVYRAI